MFVQEEMTANSETLSCGKKRAWIGSIKDKTPKRDNNWAP